MILGFCGRMRSGKTELSKICEKNGYRKLYFALPLKQLCADILDISIDGLNKAKNEGTDIGLCIGDDICSILSDETDIPLENVKQVCLGKTLNNVREMLQFIGTDLIRQYNTNWHVDRIRNMIDTNHDYVIDDVRFPNEKALIEELGGDCWFVTRTTLENISNHESETSLTWHNCWNKVIVNDSTLANLLFKWEIFMDNYKQSKATRDKEFNKILSEGLKEDISSMSVLDILMLHKSMFTYIPKEYEKEDIKSIRMNEDKTVFITYNDDSMELIDNQLAIEDLKILL